MDECDWRTNPKIQAARAYAQRHQCDAVVILSFRGRAFELASYGTTGRLCKAASVVVDRIDHLITNGWLDCTDIPGAKGGSDRG